MNFNAILDINDVTEDSGVMAEPVTIQEFKNYMRLEGFVDDDASTTDALSDFDFDDNLINELLAKARQIIEKGRDEHLILKTLQVVVTNLSGMIHLPGPVNTKPTAIDENGVTIDPSNIKMVGDYLKWPLFQNMTLTYSAGHVYCPKNLKIEVMRIAAFFYLHRDEDEQRKYVASFPGRIMP